MFGFGFSTERNLSLTAMNRLYVTIIAFFLFLGLVQAQVPRDAAILVESQRGELFYLAIGPASSTPFPLTAWR